MADDVIELQFPSDITRDCNFRKVADTTYVKRLFALLLAVAVMWPQIIVPCSRKETHCGQAACGKCGCAMVCCDSHDSTRPEPVALPSQNALSSVQWTIPQQSVIFYLPAQGRIEATHTSAGVFLSATPLFLRNCTQLI